MLQIVAHLLVWWHLERFLHFYKCSFQMISNCLQLRIAIEAAQRGQTPEEMQAGAAHVDSTHGKQIEKLK